MEITHGSSGGSGGNPAGSDTEVQFNDGGVFGADPRFTYDAVTGFLSVTPGSIEVSDLYVEGQQKLLAAPLEFNDAGNTVAYTTLSSTVQDLFVISDATIDQTALTLARNYALPDASGTFALTSDIPSIFSGQATVDFGAVSQEDSIARVTVATASVASSSIVTVSPAGIATADHDPDDYQWDNISGYVSNIVDGISFDIIGVAPNGAFGDYAFNYAIT